MHIDDLADDELAAIFLQARGKQAEQEIRQYFDSSKCDYRTAIKNYVQANFKSGVQEQEKEKEFVSQEERLHRYSSADYFQDGSSDSPSDSNPEDDIKGFGVHKFSTPGSIFDALDLSLDAADTDSEAVTFLVSSAKQKLWMLAFNPATQVESLVSDVSVGMFRSEYSSKVGQEFLNELQAVTFLQLPSGYQFKDSNGNLAAPNRMQKYLAHRVRQERHIINLSDAGSGKTLAAVLASRYANCQFSLIIAPVGALNHWKTTILNAFPECEVQMRTFLPTWETDPPKFLLHNYEMYQQEATEERMAEMLKEHDIDCLMLDEAHKIKQRYTSRDSKRRSVITHMSMQLKEKNPELIVIAQTATPVINNLQEAKSLIEFTKARRYDDIEAGRTLKLSATNG